MKNLTLLTALVLGTTVFSGAVSVQALPAPSVDARPVSPSFSAGTPMEGLIPAAAQAAHTSLAEAAGGMRAAVASASLAATARANLGLPAPATAPSPAPAGTTFEDALDGLAAAVTDAAGRVDMPDDVAGSLREALRRAKGFSAQGAEDLAATDITEPIDKASNQRVLLELTAALDLYLPVLQRSAATAPSRTGQACDLVDQPPYLCAGGADANVHTSDYALIIDTGGADTYRNSAGGAPFRAGDTWIPVSVTVDLAGDDVYSSTAASFLGQGAGMLGGIGILVDTTGNDLYSASPNTANGSPSGSVIAQGAGLAGTGILWDAGGIDRYLISGGAGFVLGQAAGMFCGADTDTTIDTHVGAGCPSALLIDRGTADDRYEIHPAEALLGEGVVVSGQAYGNLGNAALVDEGGGDVFSVRIVAGSGLRPGAAPAALTPPRAWAYAQSYAVFGATSLLLTGSQATRYEVVLDTKRAENRFWGQSFAYGQHAYSLIDDLGGNDAYAVDQRIEDTRRLAVDQGCECNRAQVAVDGFPLGIIYSVDTLAQAVGYLAGVAVLADHAGNDTYSLEGTHDFDVELSDRLPQATGPAKLAVLGYPAPATRGQAYTNVGGGVALLSDAGGTDSYRLRSRNITRAAATSVRGDEPEVLALGQARRNVGGQGSSGITYGDAAVLADLGGTGDRIEAWSENPVTTTPAGGAFQDGGEWPGVQGNFGGALIALGSNPVILSHPSNPVCPVSQGHRGFGQWSDCVVSSNDPQYQRGSSIPVFEQLSFGLAPGASGARPSIQFLPGSASSSDAVTFGFNAALTADVPWVPVEVRLADPAGKPLAGVAVHFDLQHGCALLCAFGLPSDAAGTYWTNLWTATATTDSDGVAVARLPVRIAEGYWNTAQSLYRVLAAYDGSPGIYPWKAGRPLALTKRA